MLDESGRGPARRPPGARQLLHWGQSVGGEAEAHNAMFFFFQTSEQCVMTRFLNKPTMI